MSIDLSKYENHTSQSKSVKTNSSDPYFVLKSFLGKKKFSDKRKARFYKEFAILIKSGVDFSRSLDILIDQQKRNYQQKILLTIRSEIVSGKSLSEAMKISKAFTTYEYFSIQIGEEVNKLSYVLDNLQNYFQKKIKVKRQLISVFSYPALVLVVTLAVLYFMLNNVVPMFSSVFRQFGGELPYLTKKIIAVSNSMPYIILSCLVLTLSIAFIHWKLRKKNFYKDFMFKALINIPFFGSLVKKVYIARFTSAFHLLLSARVPLISSVEITRKLVTFYPIQKTLNIVKEDLMKGVAFNKSLEAFKIYDHNMVSMLKIAEETNELDYMFGVLSDQYTEEIEHQTKLMGVIIEPLVIVFVGLIVGVIMIAMYSPMFDLSKIMGSN